MPSLATILSLLYHPTELRSIINYKIWHDVRDIKDPKDYEATGYDRASMKRCWELLDETSRTFAMVSKELEGDLARIVCIFYLVLRALDTVEDDMTIPNSIKLPLLRSFHLKLHEPGWTFNGSGPNEKDRATLTEFNVISEEFARLDEKYQIIIKDVCQKMGRGMADFAALSTPEMPVAEVDSIADYDLYCHYVAGMVGEGLSGLFAVSGKEREWIADQLTLSNSMGLLLQKTNIFRDVNEDVLEGRGFWPRAIWGKYGFESMKGLIDPAREREALWAASEMVLDALRHAVDALDYMTLLKNQSVFNFVAIPAVMAMATLERCFMNPKIFQQNVKIRKGEAVQLIMRAVNPRDVSIVFRKYAKGIHSKVHKDDPNLLQIGIACGKIEQWCEHRYPSFLEVSGASNPSAVVNQQSNDARAPLIAKIYKEAREKIEREKREAMMADLRARGLIKDPVIPKLRGPDGEEIKDESPEERARREKAIADEGNLAIYQVIGMIVGIIAVMGLMAWGIVWVILKYADVLKQDATEHYEFAQKMKAKGYVRDMNKALGGHPRIGI